MSQITFELPNNLSRLNKNQKKIKGYFYHTLDSTNNQAWKISQQQQAKIPFFVIAEQQTAGKGQRGNKWLSPLGGLYLSLYLPVAFATINQHHLTLLTVNAVVGKLRLAGIPAQIKWLNDLILDKKKLGGILCETKVEQQQISQVVIGIGINYQNSFPVNSISLSQWQMKHQKKIRFNSPLALAKLIIIGVLESYKIYIKLGIDLAIRNYNSWLYNLKKSILIADNKGEIIGINKNAQLVVKIFNNYAKIYLKLSPEKYNISYNPNKNGNYLIKEK